MWPTRESSASNMCVVVYSHTIPLPLPLSVCLVRVRYGLAMKWKRKSNILAHHLNYYERFASRMTTKSHSPIHHSQQAPYLRSGNTCPFSLTRIDSGPTDRKQTPQAHSFVNICAAGFDFILCEFVANFQHFRERSVENGSSTLTNRIETRPFQETKSHRSSLT